MPYFKSALAYDAAQIPCAGARNYGKYYLRYATLERAGMLKNKAA